MALILGINRATLRKKLKKYRLYSYGKLYLMADIRPANAIISVSDKAGLKELSSGLTVTESRFCLQAERL